MAIQNGLNQNSISEEGGENRFWWANKSPFLEGVTFSIPRTVKHYRSVLRDLAGYTARLTIIIVTQGRHSKDVNQAE